MKPILQPETIELDGDQRHIMILVRAQHPAEEDKEDLISFHLANRVQSLVVWSNVQRGLFEGGKKSDAR